MALGGAAERVRVATAVDGQRGAALLRPEPVRTMRPTPRPSTGDPGSGVPAVAAEVAAGRGSAPCSARPPLGWRAGGAIAVVVPSLPATWPAFRNDAIPALGQAVDAIRAWPERDLFHAEAPATPSA